MKIKCNTCGIMVIPMLKAQCFSNGTRHIKATCPFCVKFIKWLSDRDYVKKATTSNSKNIQKLSEYNGDICHFKLPKEEEYEAHCHTGKL